MSKVPLNNLIQELTADFSTPGLLWEGVALLLAVGVGLLVSRWLRPHLQRQMDAPDTPWQRGADSVSRVTFPLAALLAVWLVQLLLVQWQRPLGILTAASGLLLVMAMIRLVVYLLRQLFRPSGWLARSERWLTWVIWLGFALHVTGLAPELILLLDSLVVVPGKHPLSLWLLLTASLSMVLTLGVTVWLSKLGERRIMRVEQLDLSLRVVMAKLVRALALFVGVMLALSVVGVDLTVFSVFSGALGVGLGFGLQKIASNYVSGFIILLDRSINPGDMLTVDNRQGNVGRLTARYLILQQGDGTEVIIPNDTLITTTVLNHTRTNRLYKLSIPVKLNPAADVVLVQKLLLEAIQASPRVLGTPAPSVVIKGMLHDCIELDGGCWVSDPELGLGELRGEIYQRLMQGLAERGLQTNGLLQPGRTA